MSPRTCVICGATFTPKPLASKQCCCSDDCKKELCRKTNVAWRAKNREALREKRRKWNMTHLEERRAYKRAWHEKHRDAENARRQQRRATKAAAEGRTIRPRSAVVSTAKRRQRAVKAAVSPERMAEIDRLQRGRDAEALRRHAATWTEAERKFARQNYKEIHGVCSLHEGF